MGPPLFIVRILGCGHAYKSHMVKLCVLVALAVTCIQCHKPRHGNEGAPCQAPFSPISQVCLINFIGRPVTVTVYNVLGESVGVAHDGVVDSTGWVYLNRFMSVSVDSTGAADTTIVFDTELTSGVYFYRVEAPDTVFTKKWMLLK
jgi:hypothetical protein